MNTSDDKFTTVDFRSLRKTKYSETGWHLSIIGRLSTLPSGRQVFRGIPFELGVDHEERWLIFNDQTDQISIPINAIVNYFIFAHFCDISHNAHQDAAQPFNEVGFETQPGELVAHYSIIYQDGSQFEVPIRRRFEIGIAARVWGQEAFAALPHEGFHPLYGNELFSAGQWGFYQRGFFTNQLADSLQYWIFALKNPYPERWISSIDIRPTGVCRLAIAGITLYHGKDHPLRYHRLETFKLTLPSPISVKELQIDIDTGIIANRYQTKSFEPNEWLKAPQAGLGEEIYPEEKSSTVFLDITANSDTKLTVDNHLFNLKNTFENKVSKSLDSQAMIEIVNSSRTWIHGKIIDESTSQITPVRISFRTSDGRYFPPYGHRHQVNANWFEDYGGDLILGSTPYAYIDGSFQIELPVGEVFVEITKGFEYEPIRKRLLIEPNQKELSIPIYKKMDWRKNGWITADTHVHFISPQTAWLEARAEGINLVNLLATQWGDLYTNIIDFTGDANVVSDDDTIVWVGTENRQHVLGHISLLGVKGNPVFPLCTGGPDESFFGDPTLMSMAEWADLCRDRDGLAILPHFPQPYCEAAADIVLGKIDAVEIRNFIPGIESSSIREWYRYLNCGYKIPAVGGTDKMSAGIPLGGVRTYALINKDDGFSYSSWVKAVRAGRTFTTSGPLIDLLVEGYFPGSQISLSKNGGRLAYVTSVESIYPVDRLEIVVNGKVIDSKEAELGDFRLSISGELLVEKSCWIAARCVSRLTAQHTWPINHVAAHTSPIYVQCGDNEIFSNVDAAYIRTLIEGGVTWLDLLSIPASPERHEALHRVFNHAHYILTEKISHHLHGSSSYLKG